MSELDVRKAEKEVDASTEHFGKAMDKLEGAVASDASRLRSRLYSVTHPREMFMGMWDRTRRSTTLYWGRFSTRLNGASRDFAKNFSGYSKNFSAQVKRNPRPYAAGAAAAAIGGIALGIYLRKKRDDRLEQERLEDLQVEQTTGLASTTGPRRSSVGVI